MVKYANLEELSVNAFWITRQRPFDNRIVADLLTTLWLILGSGLMVLSVKLLLQVGNDLDLLASVIEGMTTISHIFLKGIPMIAYRQTHLELYERTKLFWNADWCPPRLRQELESYYKTAYYFAYTFRAAVYCTLILFYIQPLFKKHELLVAVYVPNYPYAFEVILATEYCIAFMVASYVSGYDILILCYCAHLIVQLKMIKFILRNLSANDENYMQHFRICVNHHKDLMNFAEKLSHILSAPMLAIYSVSIFIACMELYLIGENSDDIARVILSVIYVSSLIAQFGMYCFPATLFCSESESVADSIYSCNWYDFPVKMQKNILFTIMRSQKHFRFMAGGLHEINAETFVIMFKTSLSFYTLMKQVKDQNA